MRHKAFWIGLGIFILVLAVLSVLLLVANFHVARDEMQANAVTSSSRWPEKAAMPPQTIRYRVEGDGPLAMALVDVLAEELPDAQAAEVTAVPDLIVYVDKADINWTPIRSRADVAVTAAFSSNGDFSFVGERPFHFQINADDTQESSQVLAASEISIHDQAAGLISRPSYVNKLAKQVAADINTMLQTHIFAAP